MIQVKFIQAIAFLVIGMFFLSFIFVETPTQPSESTYGQFVDINGQPVELSQYFGKYLWVDYAAEWCSYCYPQTETLKEIAEQYASKVDFLTIVTGTDVVMQAPNVQAVREWADKHNLDPRMVIGRFYTDRLPYNLLYSPEGAILYQSSGLLNANEIRNIILHHIGSS